VKVELRAMTNSHYAPVMHSDGRIDQIAPECPQPRQCAILVRARQPTVSGYVGSKYRRDFPCLAHAVPSRYSQ